MAAGAPIIAQGAQGGSPNPTCGCGGQTIRDGDRNGMKLLLSTEYASRSRPERARFPSHADAAWSHHLQRMLAYPEDASLSRGCLPPPS